MYNSYFETHYDVTGELSRVQNKLAYYTEALTMCFSW